jgi:FdrA protein
MTGTEGDPQVRSQQIAILERAGVTVAPSNAHAAELALPLCRT